MPNDAELPRWIKVKELFGEVEDPLNLVAEALIEDGWEAVSVYEHPATLGGPPTSPWKSRSRVSPGFTSDCGRAAVR